MKRLSILGSTGSIGTNTLEVVRHLKDPFEVVCLSTNKSIELLEQQIKEFKPKLACVFDEKKAAELQKKMPHQEILTGMEGLIACATHNEADMVVSAINGNIGLLPTMEAIKAKKHIALATKEVLVSAGKWVMELAREYQVNIIPIDSEHTAIFQCLNGENYKNIDRIILTSSGGPFRKFDKASLKNVTLEDALKHPNYSMGYKVTIDSSTLMNKGLEVIEARWLYDTPFDKIDVVVHPQQIIHSMVEFCDRSMMAQMGDPDMLIPIQYALTYPEREPGILPRFDFVKNPTLEFFPPNTELFPCLRLAYEAGRAGESAPCFMNAANEVLVHRFYNKEISWNEIAYKLENLMERHPIEKITDFGIILEVEKQAHSLASKV